MADASTGVAVLIDPGIPDSLAPILTEVPVPLLPVGTKPLIAHWLERLVEAGIRDVRLLLSHLPERTRQFVGDGSRWGLNVSYAVTNAKQVPDALWEQVSDIPVAALLVSRLDHWPTTQTAPWIRDTLVQAPRLALGAGNWLAQLGQATSFSWLGEWAHPPAETLIKITDLKGYWQLNMDLVSGRLLDPLPYGFEAEPGVWVASNCRMERGSSLLGPSILGESSIVSGRSVLGPNAVVGDHVVIEAGVNVNNAVIFPRSFIGSHILVSESIVAGDVIHNVTSDLTLYINDPAIVARRERLSQRITVGQRIIAAALILLLAPFWLLIVLLLRISGRQGLMTETRYLEDGVGLSGERMFSAIRLQSLNVAHPLWRRSTWLGQVVAGRLTLVGTSPRLTDEVIYPDWVSTAEQFEPGVVTLATVTKVAESDLEATVVADAYQMARNLRGVDPKLIGQWLWGLIKLW